MPAMARPGRWRKARRMLIAVAGIVLAWWLLLFVMQDWIMFPRGLIPPSAQRSPGEHVHVWRLPVEGSDDGHVEAWFVPVPGASAEDPRPAVMFFHGNAELIDHQQFIVQGYHRLGVSVLLAEYRGYGRSAGRPSQAGIGQDMRRFHDQLASTPEVDARAIVFHGRSLGAAVAADLSRHHTPAGLILESTFVSTQRMARRFLAPAILIRNPFRTDEVVREATFPLLLLHGRDDDIIHVRHGRTLRDLAPPTLLTYREFDARHNDFPGPGNEPAYWQTIETFLSDL